jgi:two-component system sensor histidine kinase CpxA
MTGFAVASGALQNWLVSRNLPEPPDAAWDRGMERAEQTLGAALDRGGREGVRRFMERLPRGIRRQVFLFDERGRELLGRDRPGRERLERLLNSGRVPFEERRLEDRDGNRYRLVVLQRAPPGRLLEPGLRGLVLRLLIAGLLSALVAWLLARHLSRPLESLGRAGRRLAAGDLAARIGPPLTERGDEFGVLARDLDHMAGELQSSQQANRQLLRDVGHELRSPLARLRVALELARKRDARGVVQELDRIELESERLEELVGQVLDLLRESAGAGRLRFEDLDLRELLEDLREAVSYELVSELRGSQSELQLEIDGPLRVRGDRELLWRAFENLLRNAMHHARSDAPVVVRAGPGEDPGMVVIRVLDRGPGVPPDRLGRLFDPFYRVQEARERETGGYGLGLAIAAAAVRRHGGSIEARNREGAGLELRVMLPVGSSGVTP